MTFVDYKEAFDSVEAARNGRRWKIKAWKSRTWMCCASAKWTARRDVVVTVEKGVRQGDPVSPNLFAACLESVIRRCDWSGLGINIGVRLNHLGFADDIVLNTESPEHAPEMLNLLDERGSLCGLVINPFETRVMRNPFSTRVPLLLEGSPTADFEEYVLLGS
ncbi:hypothetical protein TELCIR_18212 [Teladorsagia circumcincta]|uniref:Reverse transcriptase domain-containing protein n=1 Tax=Teladorsagia circumcincta TaxID=45464 RepID=A0A2G9TQS3_TELCI|nr:hypothetical protein TELCIR_18212 [Teladorsagia circumcincta]